MKGKSHECNLKFKVIDEFDLELQDFISSYILSKSSKRSWIEDTCNIKFKLPAAKREMYLSASKDTRSKIDITTFPSQFKGDLDSTWVSIREGRRANKQPRDQPDTFMTPPKKVRSSDVEYLSPIVKNVNVPISEMNTQVIIPNLKSFGYKCSEVIESALMKSIRRALRKRDIYILTIVT